MFWDELGESDEQGDLEGHLSVVLHTIAKGMGKAKVLKQACGLQELVEPAGGHELDPI
jgi:hypothetical protein